MNSKASSFIGLDLGTSAVKGVLLNTDGQVLKTVVCPTTYEYPQPGRVEGDALRQYQELTAVIRELAAASPWPVKALALAAASGNTLLADEEGHPLCPVINWMDKRCAGNPPKALHGLTPDGVREVTGWPCVESFPLAHLAWLQAYKPALYHSAARVCMNTDWLLFQLTGQWVMDYSTATTFHLLNQVLRTWHGPYLERLGLSESRLSRLAGSGVAVGPLTACAAEACNLSPHTLAATGCFDHPASALASGIQNPGQLMLSCGTSWVGFVPWLERQSLLDAGMLVDPFRSEQGGCWGGMFPVTAIGPAIDWYVDHLIAPGEENRLRIFDELAAQAAPGADGLEIDLLAPPQPLQVDRGLISRAVMEGAARALNAHLLRLKDHGFEFKQAVLVGGPGKSPVWPEIIADMTGLELTVGSAYAGATGAAMLAADGVGIELKTNEANDPAQQPIYKERNT